MSATIKIPYNRVHAAENILFATRGGKIHSFNLSDSSHISTWQHPDVEKYMGESAGNSEQKAEDSGVGNVAEVDDNGPPAKRQKTEEAPDAAAQGTEVTTAQPDASQKKGKQNKGKGKNKPAGLENHGEQSRMGRVSDRPIITLMTSTADGKHLVAVSGHDKALWVFEHDGAGKLNQLSKRVMPKRPSSIAVGPDAQIIAADKFGDVYSLPLLMVPQSPSLAVRTASPASADAKHFEPAANTFTVHSKRNLEALSNQRKQMEQERARKAANKQASEEENFDLTLLLGHVSMLTGLIVAESEGRRYILTSDRDEHIRVSRYIPHAHVIEGFCLGHKDFVSDIVMPEGRTDVLVSGGGEEDLFVWDWKSSKLLSRMSLLSLVREIAPETSKIAVSGLTSLEYASENGTFTYVIAICEGIKAVFAYSVTDENELKNPSAIQLPGKPLHIFVAKSHAENEPPKLIVAMDPGQNPHAKSLHGYTLAVSENRLVSGVEMPIHGDSPAGAEMQVSDGDVRSLFYTVENLRKQTGSAVEDNADQGAEDGAADEAQPSSATEA